MRVRSIRLKDFKRFNDLTIDLGDRTPKIVALVGPNGSGKSSVFDAFEELGSMRKGHGGKEASYYKKSVFGGTTDATNRYEAGEHITLVSDQGENYDRTSFYIRSAYRFTARLAVDAIRKLPKAAADQNRPNSLIDTDSRLPQNYERLLGQFYDDVYDKDVTGRAWAQANIDGLNAVLEKVLDIIVSFLGNPVSGEGSLYFTKGASTRFPYANLSSGEKEVIDLVLDLFVKRDLYPNAVICIDEPELHLNTAIQRKLLGELEKLVPEGSQLWIATHSIGFLRALQEDLPEKTAVIDFTGSNFDGTVALKLIAGTRSDWLRIFETALEDLTGLMAPKQIVYCEGRTEATPAGADQGLDAEVYNQVFASTHQDTFFVSAGGGAVVQKNALLGLRVLKKALLDVTFLILKDRDENTGAEKTAFLAADTANRMLSRREIENYLFDKEVLTAFCGANGKTFDEARYDGAVTAIATQDLKLVQQTIQHCCDVTGDIGAFKRELSRYLLPGIAAYIDLEACIFIP